MGRRPRRPALSARERLLFEAGIKLGGVFHQYLGIPVTRATAPGLSRTIEAALRLQPYVDQVTVRIYVPAGPRGGPRRYAYRYLTAEMLRVDLTVREGATTVLARLAYRPELDYPLMEVRPPRRTSPRRGRPTTARRSGRTGGRSGPRTGRSAGSV